jgi:hypothetical protein
MLDASVVLSKIGTGTVNQRCQLSPASPDVIVDAGPGGATVVAVDGTVQSATIDNAYVPGAWTAVPGAGQAVAAGRRAFKLAGPGLATLAISWA